MLDKDDFCFHSISDLFIKAFSIQKQIVEYPSKTTTFSTSAYVNSNSDQWVRIYEELWSNRRLM
jgi:hypothetical protein